MWGDLTGASSACEFKTPAQPGDTQSRNTSVMRTIMTPTGVGLGEVEDKMETIVQYCKID